MNGNNHDKVNSLKWNNLLKRMQASARSHNASVAFMQVTLVIDASGNPQFWTPPKVVPLEPRVSVDFEKLQNEMSDKDMQTLLEYIVKTS